jgi:hypothetical protein
MLQSELGNDLGGNASQALRFSWASVFYLITTDILGPLNAPFAISQTGWVPGTTASSNSSQHSNLSNYYF